VDKSTPSSSGPTIYIYIYIYILYFISKFVGNYNIIFLCKDKADAGLLYVMLQVLLVFLLSLSNNDVFITITIGLVINHYCILIKW
jgi:hypothetical protein